MRQKLRALKNFIGPYDYRPGFIYFTILVFNLSNLRAYTYHYEYGVERIQFFFSGLFAYVLIGLPLYLALNASRRVWTKRKKSLFFYLLEMLLASLITLCSQIVGQKYLIPFLDTENFMISGIFVGEFIVRFVFAVMFVAITHTRLRILGTELGKASALNAELNQRYAALIAYDEKIRSQASQLLHDRIQSKLMLAGAKLTRISEVLTVEGKLGIAPVIKDLEHIRSIDAREVSQLLTPNIAGEGLIGSCENLKSEFSGDIEFIVEIPQYVEKFKDELKLGIYRIIEQGVINSIKHGPASRISICVVDSEQSELKIEVIDNGPGAKEIGSGKGSVIIDAWLSILGGRKEIESQPENGFALRVYLPQK